MNKLEATKRLAELEDEASRLRAFLTQRSILNPMWRWKNKGEPTLTVDVPSKDYAQAFETMMALRMMDGTVEYVDGVTRWVVDYIVEQDGEPRVYTESWMGDSVIVRISPAFESRERAQNAIDRIGVDVLVKMFETLHSKAGW